MNEGINTALAQIQTGNPGVKTFAQVMNIEDRTFLETNVLRALQPGAKDSMERITWIWKIKDKCCN